MTENAILLCMVCFILLYNNCQDAGASVTKMSSLKKLEPGEELIGQLTLSVTVKTQMDCLFRYIKNIISCHIPGKWGVQQKPPLTGPLTAKQRPVPKTSLAFKGV